jgi:RuvA N terminal domain
LEPYIFGEKSGYPRVWSEHRRPALTIMPGGFRRVHGRHSKRQVEAVDPGRLSIETAGVGYEIFVPLNTYYRMPSMGAEVELEIRQIAAVSAGFNLDHVDVAIARSRMSARLLRPA